MLLLLTAEPYLFFTTICVISPFAHTTTNYHHVKPYLDDSSVGGAGAGNGQKAIIAISEDNQSGVIKYRSEQDMVSICEYQCLPDMIALHILYTQLLFFSIFDVSSMKQILERPLGDLDLVLQPLILYICLLFFN